MKIFLNKITLLIYASLIILVLGGMYTINTTKVAIKSDGESNSELDTEKGYTGLVGFKDNYYAIGSDERIDLISKGGDKVTLNNSGKNKLNYATANKEIFIAVGENGTILYSVDGKKFSYAESNTDKCIYGIAYKDGIYFAGSESGEILVSEDGKVWFKTQTHAKGNILSLSSNSSIIIGVTDAGEIIKSSDGIDWEIKDYNKEYSGYNEYSNFIKIYAIDNTIVIIGTHEDGTPSILISTLGNVWSERIPIYYDEEGILRYLDSKPNDITYDLNNNQFIVACDNGELLSLPTCSKCNKYLRINEINLNAIIIDGKNLVIAGDGFSVFKQRL